MRRLLFVLSFAAVLLPLGHWSPSARAQALASVSGTVRDPSGGALPGATITLTAEPLGATRSTVTDSDGRYTFGGLPAGSYRVNATLSGFGNASSSVTTRGSENTALDITLELTPFTETVTVTRAVEDRSRIPNAVAVIDGATIQSFQRRASPAETFQGVPGFYVENRRNFSLSGGVRLAIRSPMPRFGMRGVQIIQDGVPMTMADGTTEPTNIDLGSLGRVEILRGPSSLLYGNSAGGVITLQSEFPSSGHLLVQPDVQVGSYGYQQQAVKVAGSTGRVSYLLNTSRLQSDGFRQHSHADVRRLNTVVRAALTNRTELRGVFNVYDLPFGESASTITRADARNNPTTVRPQALTQGWGESTTQKQMGVSLQHHIRDGHVFRATVWSLWRDVWNPVPNSIVSVGRRATGLRSEYSGTLPTALPVTWTAGVDVSSQHDERAEYANAGVPAGGGLAQQGRLQLAQLEEVLSVGPFVQLAARLGDRWNLTGGIRYDRYTFDATDRFLTNGDQSGGRRMAKASPMAGLTWLASSSLNVYANIASAYQTPTTVELSNRPDNQGGFNPDLGPETLRSAEIGVRGAINPWRLRFEVANYYSHLDNVLVRFTRADEQAYFRNAGEANRKGLEVLTEWSPTGRLKARASYTRQAFRFGRFVAPEGNFSDKLEPGAPPHQVVLGGSYDAKFGLFSSLQYRFVASYWANSQNTLDNWAYHVVDARWGVDRTVKGVRLRPFVSIDNLFNQRYNSSVIINSLGDRHYEPAPGREFAVGLTIGGNLF